MFVAQNRPPAPLKLYQERYVYPTGCRPFGAVKRWGGFFFYKHAAPTGAKNKTSRRIKLHIDPLNLESHQILDAIQTLFRQSKPYACLRQLFLHP